MLNMGQTFDKCRTHFLLNYDLAFQIQTAEDGRNFPAKIGRDAQMSGRNDIQHHMNNTRRQLLSRSLNPEAFATAIYWD